MVPFDRIIMLDSSYISLILCDVCGRTSQRVLLPSIYLKYS